MVGTFAYTSCQSLSTNSKTKYAVESTIESACINQNSTYDYKLDNFVKIKVGKNTEVIVDLVNIETEKTVRTAHIKRKQEHYIRHIPEGKYRLHVIYGEEYTEETSNEICKGFFKKQTSTDVDENILDTYIQKTSGGINVPSYSISFDLPDSETSDKLSK
ncbi:hypothetical protein GCM10022259_14450 [Aquimarina mytili]